MLFVAAVLVVPQAPVAEAAKPRPTISVTRSPDGTSFVAAGRTDQRSVSVYIQRWTGKKWVSSTKVASKNHKYSVRLTPTVTTRYRAYAAKRASSSYRTAQVLRDACGIRPPKSSTTFWSCTLADDFNGTALNRSRWVPQVYFDTGTDAGRACYVDSPDNISVSGGALHLTVREEDEPVVCATDGSLVDHSAGMVTTYRSFSQAYGRFEARFRTAAADGPGLHEAFWLWPDDRDVDVTKWPASGEIDVVETYSLHPSLAIPYLHYTANDNGGTVPGVNTAWNCAAQRGVYNTYRVDWTSASISIYVNDRLCMRNTSRDPAFTTKYIVALTEALGGPGNEFSSSTPLPATMDVDYVKVWK